jgi:hypothetical protein
MTLSSLPFEIWILFFGGCALSFGLGAVAVLGRKPMALLERYVRAHEKQAESSERIAIRWELLEQHIGHGIDQQFHAVR